MSSQDFFEREPDELEHYLIAQGRRDRPADDVRQRAVVLASLAASTASAGLATASIASGSSAAAAAPWIIAAKWVAIGVASGMATIGAAEGLRYQRYSDLATPSAVVLPAVPSTTARGQARPGAPQGGDEISAPSPAPPLESLVGLRAQPMLSRSATAERAPPAGPLDEMSRRAVNDPNAIAIGNRSADAVVRDEAPVRAVRQSGGGSKESADTPSQGPSSPPAKERERDLSLKSELGYLEEARIALEAHVGASAMRALDEYAQQFPSDSMRIEAIALRVEALLVLGRRSDAQALGNDFLSRYPASPAAMRVRLLLGARDNAPSKR